MKRKFEPSKLYKLLKIIVNIVSVLFFIYFVFLLAKYNEGIQFRTKLLEECYAPINVCLDIVRNHEQGWNNGVKLAAALGIGLPILFYGSIALYRYLFPIKNKKENEKS